MTKETAINPFEEKQVRTVWDAMQEKLNKNEFGN